MQNTLSWRYVVLLGLLGLFLNVSPAWSQTTCNPAVFPPPNFCNHIPDFSFVFPSPPALGLPPLKLPTPSYPFLFGFVIECYDYFTGALLNCGYSVEILKDIEPTPPPFNPNDPSTNLTLGGHFHTSPSRAPGALIEPPGTGSLMMGTGSGMLSANKLKMSGTTQNNVVQVLYPVPQASGDFLIEELFVFPFGYLCVAPCFDQVSAIDLVTPLRGALYREQHLLTIHVGTPPPTQEAPLFPLSLSTYSELRYTDPANPGLNPFLLTGDTIGVHPFNHFGTDVTISNIIRIAKAYQEAIAKVFMQELNVSITAKLGINDMSLIRGGAFDVRKLSPMWIGDSNANPHWGHRTGTEMDIDGRDSLGNLTSCDVNARVQDAVEKVLGKALFSPTVPPGALSLKPQTPYRCESQGRNHVYVQ